MLIQLLVSLSLFLVPTNVACSDSSEQTSYPSECVRIAHRDFSTQPPTKYGVVEAVSSLAATTPYEGQYVRWGNKIYQYVRGKWEPTEIVVADNAAPDDGVYVVDAGGHYHQPAQWQGGVPVSGIAVVENGTGMMLSTECFTLSEVGRLAVADKGVIGRGSAAEAQLDFSGVENTRQLEKLQHTAAMACANYTFLHGDRGFLLSAGEACRLFRDHGEAICDVMERVGGWSIDDLSLMATSTIQTPTVEWAVQVSPSSSGNLQAVDLSDECKVVPAAKLPLYCFDYPYAENPEDNVPESDGMIHFIDDIARSVCLLYDTDGDGELSYEEASNVLDIDWDFAGKKMKSFDELVYFTSLTTIFEPCFNNCTLLETITLPENVTSVGYTPFTNCPALRDIRVADGNKYYSNVDGVLLNRMLTTVVRCPQAMKGDYVMPRTVNFVNQNAFNGCKGITSLDIPHGVSFIDNNAFASCTGLQTVKVHWTTPLSLSTNIFSNIKLANVTLQVPAGTSEAYREAYIWGGFGNIVEYDDMMQTVDFTDEEVKRVCLAHWDGDGDGLLSMDEAAAVTSLNGAFRGNCLMKSFDELSYFTGLKSLAKGEFEGCSLLQHLLLPEALATIGEGAFRDCTSLLTFDVGKSVTSIGDEAFDGTPSLREFTVASGNTAFKTKAGVLYDRNMTRLVRYPIARNYMSFNIPTSVKTVSAGAFSGCPSLAVVVVPQSVTSIGSRAFYGCTAMQRVTLPSSVSSLGDYAFAGCCSMESFSWTANATTLPAGLLAGCSALSSITLPKAATIRANALAGTSISELPEMAATSIGDYSFAHCTMLQRACLPSTLNAIGDGAFLGCSSLALTRLPASLASLGHHAFYLASAGGILPQDGTSNGNSSLLTKVLVEGLLPLDIAESTFSNYTDCNLYVREQVMADYAAADVWRQFGNILPLHDGDIDLDGRLSVADVMSLVTCILQGEYVDTFGGCPMQFDVNHDGLVSVADIMKVVSCILGM